MDLQLNISSLPLDVQKKSKKAKTRTSSDYHFVKKPNIGGKTFAKMKNNLNKDRKVNLALLKNAQSSAANRSVDSGYEDIQLNTTSTAVTLEKNKEIGIKLLNSAQKKKSFQESAEDFDNGNKGQSIQILNKESDPNGDSIQLNTVVRAINKKNQMQKKERKIDFSQNSVDDVPDRVRKRNFAQSNSPGESGGRLKDSLGRAIDKKNKVSVSSLFKNNPSVTHIGQRAVLPLSEKLFSGESFADLHIHAHQLANLQQNLGLKELMTVQQRASPVILQGRDTLVRSQTGSGKTLAYALPIIEALQAIRPKVNRSHGIKALVIVPTRELATQTYDLFVKLVKPFVWIVCGVLSGGQKRKAEKAHLRKGITVLVATPGRLRDHLQHTKSLQFENVRCLVLDEADRLLDMGYEKDVSAVVKALEEHQNNAKYKPLDIVKQSLGIQECAKVDPDEEVNHELTRVFKSERRQTVLLSATLTKAVEKLAGLTMAEPVFVDALEGKKPLIADSLTFSPSDQFEKSPVKIEKAAVKSVKNAVKFSKKPVKTESEEDSNESGDDSEKSDSDDDDSDDTERLGLKSWNGFEQRELLDLPEAEPKNKEYSEDNSDADSDYDFFRSQKQTADEHRAKVESDDDEEEDENQAGNSFRNAIKQAIDDEDLVIPESVDQSFLVIPMKLRLVTLASMVIDECLKRRKSGKILVFMATQELVDFHCNLLETALTSPRDDEDTELVIPVDLHFFQLHGSMEHSTRLRVFKQFRDAKSGVLICTDVAARGLDLPYVDTVIQYTIPSSAADYVHRVGRTGRAGRNGRALLILLPEEVPFISTLADRRIRIRQEEGEHVLKVLSRRFVPAAVPVASFCTQADRERAASFHNIFEELVSSSDAWTQAASKAFASWCRQYRTYPRAIRSLVGNLHLGHACRSLAIKDVPKNAAARARAAIETGDEKKMSARLHFEEKEGDIIKPKLKKPIKKTLKDFPLSRRREVSEFDSGLEPILKKMKFK